MYGTTSLSLALTSLWEPGATWASARDFFQHAGQLGGGVNRAGDLPPHHQIIGAVADGLGGGGHALLVALGGAGGADARRDQDGVRTHNPAKSRGFERRGYNAIHAGLHRLARAPLHQVGDFTG